MSGQSKAQSFPAKFAVAKMVCAHNIPSLPPSYSPSQTWLVLKVCDPCMVFSEPFQAKPRDFVSKQT